MTYVYILYSASLGKYYKGQTNDLQNRLYRHNNKQEKATSFGVPWTLVIFYPFSLS
ncbi:MAG: GIY-YIG nuclease family protein [Fibrobacterota bacterium]